MNTIIMQCLFWQKIKEYPSIWYAQITNGKTVNCICKDFSLTLYQDFRENFDIISVGCKFRTMNILFLPTFEGKQ